MEVEKPLEEFSKEELRRQLYSSLRSTGVLDSMKGQLRARLLEHLRQRNGDEIQPNKRQGKPSLTERLLSSLFLDYLESEGFTFTVSVFMPESQMATLPPFSHDEMLRLLHLDPSSDLHFRLKLGDEGTRQCLAHQLVTLLQQMAQRSCIQEVSTQTSPAEACRQQQGVEDPYSRKREAHETQRLLPYRSLEDKITILHQEFDARVNAEVALQVSRLREYEINAARMDEAARYRRQLARDREELEDIHKARMDRIKAREESLLERMLSKEKAIEASAYDQRQRILTEITGLRERENKLRQFKESQEHREEKLDERELSLRAKEEEVVRVRKTLYDQADDITALRWKELEEQYKELCDRLHHDRTLLEAEREQMKEEKVAMAIELAASRSDKQLIQALRSRQSMEEDRHLNLVQTIKELEKLKQQSLSAPAPVYIPDQRLEERLLDLQAELEQERLQRHASEKENKTLERKVQQKKVELAAAQSPQAEWITEHKNLMATIHQQEAELLKQEMKLQFMETEREKMSTRHRLLLLKIDHLDTLVKKAREEKDRALCNLEILQLQHTSAEKELHETTMLLRKAQQALEAERLEHGAVRSHMKVVPSISLAPQRDSFSQDQHGQNHILFNHNPSADEAFGKKWESFRKKPKRESHDLWTQILSDNASKRASLDQDLGEHFSTSTISKPFSAGFGYQLLELHHDGFAKEGITTVTQMESLMETVVTGSIEEYYTSSWDQERYAEHRYEDAIPSWRKTHLPEVARPGSWNNGYEDSSVTDVVTNRQCDWRKVDMGWNLGRRDRMRWDMAYFEGEERLGEKYNDFQESLNGFQDFEMTTQIRSASDSRAANIRNFRDSDTASVERKAFLENLEEKKSLEDRHAEPSSTMKSATKRTRRDTPTMEIKCQGRLTSSFDDQEVENLKPFLKEKDSATSNDEEEQSQTTNIRTSMDISSVEDNNFKSDSWDPENHKPNGLVLTQGVANGSLFTERDIPCGSYTEEDDEHVEKQGAESPWNPYLGELDENTRDNSEVEKSGRDSPSCKCLLSLKYNLESSEESAQGRDEREGDHQKTADSATDVPKNPPLIDNMQLLNSAQSVDSRSCEYVKCKERVKGNHNYSQRDIGSKTVEEDKTTQVTQGDEAHESTNRVNEVTEVTSLAPDRKQIEGAPSKHSPTLSISDSDNAQDPDKDLNQLMRSLGLTVTTNDEPKKCSYKKEEELLSKKASSLSKVNSQKEESRRLAQKSNVPVNGKMSGLPEIGEMLFNKEMHAKGKAQNNLLQDSTEGAQDRANVKGNSDINFSSSQTTTLPTLETLQTSIVIRKQEVPTDKEMDKETGKESPRLMDAMNSHKNHPILALAIRNNQLVKLETQHEFPKEGKDPFLSESHTETIMNRNLTNDEPRFSKETPRLVNIQHASEPTHIQEEAHSSSEESIYKGDSFEEEEDEVDQKPTYSKESCTDEGMRVSSEQAPDSLGPERNKRSSPCSEADESRSLRMPPENWGGESEQHSYSPDEDDTVPESIESLETCGS